MYGVVYMAENIRINLSQIKGMNVKQFAHASNEVVKLVNLKPADNGLEQRNSKQKLLDKSVLDTKDFEKNYPFIRRLNIQGVQFRFIDDTKFIVYNVNSLTLVDIYGNVYDTYNISEYGLSAFKVKLGVSSDRTEIYLNCIRCDVDNDRLEWVIYAFNVNDNSISLIKNSEEDFIYLEYILLNSDYPFYTYNNFYDKDTDWAMIVYELQTNGTPEYEFGIYAYNLEEKSDLIVKHTHNENDGYYMSGIFSPYCEVISDSVHTFYTYVIDGGSKFRYNVFTSSGFSSYEDHQLIPGTFYSEGTYYFGDNWLISIGAETYKIYKLDLIYANYSTYGLNKPLPYKSNHWKIFIDYRWENQVVLFTFNNSPNNFYLLSDVDDNGNLNLSPIFINANDENYRYIALNSKYIIFSQDITPYNLEIYSLISIIRYNVYLSSFKTGLDNLGYLLYLKNNILIRGHTQIVENGDIFLTKFRDLFIVSREDPEGDVSDILGLRRPITVIKNKTDYHDDDTDFIAYDYDPQTKWIYNAKLIRKDGDIGRLNKYGFDGDIRSAWYTDDGKLRMVVTDNTSGNYPFDYSDNVEQTASFGSDIASVCRAYGRYVADTTTSLSGARTITGFPSSSDIMKVWANICFNDGSKDWDYFLTFSYYSSFDEYYINIYSYDGTTLTNLLALQDNDILDFYPLYLINSGNYTNNWQDGAYFIVAILRTDGLYYLKVKFNVANTLEALNYTKVFDMPNHNYTKLSGRFQEFETAQNYFDYNSVWVFNEDEAEEIAFTMQYDDTDGSVIVDNTEVLDKFHKSKFPQFDEGILDIAVRPFRFEYPINKSINTPVRPYFKIGTTDTVLINTPSDPTYDYRENFYTVPVLKNSIVPIDFDNRIDFDPIKSIDSEAGTMVRHLHWLLYVLPLPAIDASADGLMLCKGWYNDKGVYEVKSYGWSQTGKVDDLIIKMFNPNDFTADNVIIYNASSGNSIFIWDKNQFEHHTKMTNLINTTDTEYNNTKIANEDYGGSVIFSTDTYSNGEVENALVTESFDLKANTEYRLKFKVKAGADGGLVVNVYKGSVGDTNNLIDTYSIDVTTSYQDIEYIFSLPNDGKYYFAFVLQSTFNNYTISAMNLFINSDFTKQIQWSLYSDEKFVITDYVEHNGIGVFADNLHNSVYFTAGGIMYIDKGNALLLASPISLNSFDYGVVVGSEKQVILVQGIESNVFNTQVLLNNGVDNRYNISAVNRNAVIYNNSGIFLFRDGELFSIGDNILPYIQNINDRYVTIDPVENKVYVNIDLEATGRLDVDFLGTDRDIYLTNGFAVYDLNVKSWYIYAYEDDGLSSGFVSFIPFLNRVVGDTGDDIAILEVNDNTQRSNDLTTERIPVYILLREMSFGNPMYLKKIQRIIIDNLTLRGYNDIKPTDYVNIKFYQNLDTYHKDDRVLKEITLTNFKYTSMGIPIDVNVYTGAIGILMARTVDNYNPKIVFKDLILTLQRKVNRKQGGW